MQASVDPATRAYKISANFFLLEQLENADQ